MSFEGLPLSSRKGTTVFQDKDVVLMDHLQEGEVLCCGTLSIKLVDVVRRCRGAVIIWKRSPDPETRVLVEPSLGSSLPKEWAVIPPPRDLEVEVAELKSYRIEPLEKERLVFIQEDGTNHKPLIFLKDSSLQDFIFALKEYVSIRQSKYDENLYILTDPSVRALDESLTRLNLLDNDTAKPVWNFLNEIKMDTYATTISAFSKIDGLLFRTSNESEIRPEAEMAEIIQRTLNTSNFEVTDEVDAGFEVITSRPKLMVNLPEVSRSDPLCQLDWELHFNDDGSVMDIDQLRVKIFKGGIEHSIRSDVWKFLLKYYDFNSTYKEREVLRKDKVNEYFQMKAQWKSITPKQESHFAAFRERKVQIEKDICRTDRDHHFFEGDNNENVKILNNVLMTYVMYNFDLGYVQGMSDLLSPILYVMQNEVDAFWCFVGFMDIVKSNFDFDQKGMKAQLAQLVKLQKLINPELYSYLEHKESGNMYFYFRWLLIWFKREFKYKDVMKLWEVLWTGLPGKNFHLILCLAILDGEMCTILENNFGFTEILKHINDMAHNINLDFVLKKAEALHIKIKGSPPEYGVSNEVREILGLPPITPLAEAKTNGKKSSSSSKPIPIHENNSSSINKLELLSQSRSNPHEDHQHQTLSNGNSSTNNNNNINLIQDKRRHRSSDGTNSLDNSSSVEVLSESYENDLVFGSSFE
ncbi:TBC1 domain family member 17 [Lepeophtheirus salmonis]|uniref:TBC1 domain family member 15 n=1 Tax=Lepeophtheirus salmonis TaxID=72036 RepID=A0A0K2V5J9_LEPSM|nr:TBC1 domain family member 17-like [Lepeophtheirus salmonis]